MPRSSFGGAAHARVLELEAERLGEVVAQTHAVLEPVSRAALGARERGAVDRRDLGLRVAETAVQRQAAPEGPGAHDVHVELAGVRIGAGRQHQADATAACQPVARRRGDARLEGEVVAEAIAAERAGVRRGLVLQRGEAAEARCHVAEGEALLQPFLPHRDAAVETVRRARGPPPPTRPSPAWRVPARQGRRRSGGGRACRKDS